MRRQRAQSVVEFGGVIVFLTLLIAAVIDFGVLMNQWLTVASDARQLARDAAVGATADQLTTEAKGFPIPGVTTDNFFAQYCCDAGAPGDALVLSVSYFADCFPSETGCTPVDTATTLQQGLDNRYGLPRGHCDHTAYPNGCQHPARPRPTNTTFCNLGNPNGNPCPGDSVVITFSASRAHMLTPILGGMCNQTPGMACMTLQNTVIMRFDGSGL